MAETKTYAYVVLSPAADDLTYRFVGEFEGRAPEQAVEAALTAKAIPSDLHDGPLKGGVIAIPASKWYVVEFEGETRIDYSFTRGGGDTGEAVEPPPPPPEDLVDDAGLKRL